LTKHLETHAFSDASESFTLLVAAAQACRRCASMDERRRVLSEQNGDPMARVMFIAEAPGRLGGELSGRPLVDDASGRHFSQLLAIAAIAREDVFITNSVLCNPQDEGGRNRKPSRLELANCSHWLWNQIAAIDPRVVVTLGGVALDAVARLERHSYRLASHVGIPLAWAGRTLIPLYHPSPLTRATRSDALQANDYHRLGEYLRSQHILRAAEP
jgi:uracil-DNA glycosylase